MFYLYTVKDRFWLREPVVALVYGPGLPEYPSVLQFPSCSSAEFVVKPLPCLCLACSYPNDSVAILCT